MDLINDLINQAIEDIKRKKEAAVRRRLLELGIYINWKKEEIRLFKTIGTITDVGNNSETYVFNNGSLAGLNIITFIQRPLNITDTNYTIGYDTLIYNET